MSHVKRTFYTKSQCNLLLWKDLFISGKSLSDCVREIDLPACVIARILLSHHLKQTDSEIASSETRMKKEITKLIQEPNKIQNEQLRVVVEEAVRIDPHFSPSGVLFKQSYGEKQELQIEDWLKENEISFQNENDLRREGFPKTPDFVLLVPVAFYQSKTRSYQVINWIESKGTFGNESQHKKYLNEQFLSYHNRFGPGLVIYWGGFVDELDLPSSCIYLSHELPNEIVKLYSKYLKKN